MNELLGLFGYDDKVNSTDTENLNLDNYAETTKPSDPNLMHSELLSDDDASADETSRSTERLKYKLRHRLRQGDSLAEQHQNLVSALKRRESSGHQKCDESSTADDDREPTDADELCDWCTKPGNKQHALSTSTGNKIFCSEVCFTQCRRASFKKSKICDWCKHVRHAVSYVELQDGDHSLQFCSEKCLNQYKMSIFCKETQEHLPQIHDGSDDSVTDKETDREILITPDLWLNGDPIKKQVEPQNLQTKHVDMRDSKYILRKTFSANIEKSVLKKMADSVPVSGEASRKALLQRIQSEAHVKHRRHFRKEAERLSSPTVAEQKPATPPPPPPVAPALPPQLLHQTLAGIAPWIHQAQLMGSMAPGINPYAAYQSMVFPGIVPPFPPCVVPEPDSDTGTDAERAERNHQTNMTSSYLVSPGTERPSMDTGRQPGDGGEKCPRTASPAVPPAARRTSSLFPMDFPQMFQNGQFPPGQFQPPLVGQTPIPPLLNTGVPPVTMMVPYPVVLPLPVPIPIPIPLTLDTLYKHFRPNQRGPVSPNDERLPLRKPRPHHLNDATSPISMALHSPQSTTSSCSDVRHFDRRDREEGSRLSDLSPSINSESEYRASISEAFSLKRSRTPDDAHSIDIKQTSPKVRKYEPYYGHSDSNDCVIDLSSKDNRDRRKSGESSSDAGLVNGEMTDEYEKCSTPGSIDNQSIDVPKIHIITHKDEAPLTQHLPLPPTGNAYSTRRGLILDAPTIPKKQRSPSPERRVYVRSVPRDIMEAARRRCVRTRVRTK